MTTSTEDLAAAAEVPQRIVAAWAKADARAFAEVFAEGGSMILPGVYRKGREEIRAYMAAAFEGPLKGTRVTGDPIDVRPLGDSAALVLTQGGVVRPGAADVDEAGAIRASWVLVREDGAWRLAGYQNSPRSAD